MLRIAARTRDRAGEPGPVDREAPGDAAVPQGLGGVSAVPVDQVDPVDPDGADPWGLAGSSGRLRWNVSG